MGTVTALAALLGAGVAFGVLLVVSGLERRETSERQLRTITSFSESRTRLARAFALAVPVLVATRWPVAAIASGLLGWCSPELLGGRASRETGVARTEAIATWTEMLRDTIAAAHGLETAIAATSPVAPDPIRSEVLALSTAIDREPLPTALRRLAEDLAHPIADLVVASLSVAATESVRELADLLGTLAASARDEAAMQLRVEAARARMRTAVQVITGCTLVTAIGLVVLNPSYVTVYASAVGQATLAVISICWGVALWWLARMSRFRTPERFLVGDPVIAGTRT
jgi:tight adherence protein B